MSDNRMSLRDSLPDSPEDSLRLENNKRLMRDASLVSLKRQAEWNDMPNPTEADVVKRIQQVQQTGVDDDPQLSAMKQLVLLALNFRLDLIHLRRDTTLWAVLKRAARRWL